jgi:hypothetical protein
MSKKNLEQLVVQMENYVECWKQFNSFITLARGKKFSPEDESQFLEIKSVITQELELILANMDCGQITRDDVHALVSSAPSVRFLSEINDGALRNVETQWHKLFIGWQSILGQLKVKQAQEGSQSILSGLFGRRAA